MEAAIKLFTTAYVVLLTIVALIPMPEAPGGYATPLDKLEHLAAFLFFALLFSLSFESKLFLLAYPVVHELLQLLVPWRSFDPLDLATNFAGVAAGLLVLEAWKKLHAGRSEAKSKKQKREKPSL